MSDWLSDPKLINYILMGFYVLNSARWAVHGSWPDSLYWFSAMCITIAVTNRHEG